MDTHVAKMVTQILDRIHRLDAPMIIAIDGRCGFLWRNGIFPHLI